MTNELTPMQTLQERLREHTKEKFAELVPPNVWQELADATIQDFTENQLPKIIDDELQKFCREKIKETLGSPEFQGQWRDYNSTLASESLKKMLVEKAPDLFAALIGSSLQGVIDQMKYNIR